MRQPVIRCSILGQSVIQLPGIRLTPEAERQFGLALFYCASAGRGIPRDEAARMFWPEHDDTAARHCLRQGLYRLRALGIPVRSGAKATTLDQRAVETDYAPVVAEGASATDYLTVADVAVLPGYDPSFSLPFAAWVEGLRADIGTRMRRGLVRAIADLRSRGRYAEVERLARQCLVLDPLNEEATLALVEAVILAGGKVEAMEMIERYEREVGRYQTLLIPTKLLRRRISDWLVEEEAANRSPVSLVGRDTELEQLFECHRQSLGGVTQEVYITGEEGVGKSSLLAEFLRMISLRDVVNAGVTCDRSDKSRALSVVTELTSELVRLPGALGAAPESLAVLRTFTSYRSATRSDTALNISQIQHALADLVDAISDEHPLIIHIDDLQWIDRDSSRVLRFLTAANCRRRLLIISCLRDSSERAVRQLPGKSSGNVSVIRLRCLSDIQSRLLLQQLLSLSPEQAADHTLDEYVKICGGNPMFLTEVGRRHQLTGERATPTTLQHLVRSRLRGLRPPEFTALQACALLGKHATVSRVARLLEMPTHRLTTAMRQLQASGLVVVADGEIRASHDVIAVAALDSAPSSSGLLLHGRAAAMLEEEAGQLDQPSLLWQAVEHAEAAHQHNDAIRLLRRLAHYLLRVGSPSEARVSIERALSHSPSPEQTWTLTSDLLIACRAEGDWFRISATLAQRRALRPHVSESGKSADDDTGLYLEAEFRIAGGLTSSLPSLVDDLHREPLDSRKRYSLALMGVIAADGALDAASAHRVMESIPTIAQDPAALCDEALPIGLVYHTIFGDLPLAQEFARETQRRTGTIDDASIQALQRLRWSTVALLYAGRFQEVEGILTRIYRVSERRRLWTEAYESARTLAQLALIQGDIADASHWHRQAEAWTRRGNDDMTRSFVAGQAALIALCRNSPEEAQDSLTRASAYFEGQRARRARCRYLALKLSIEAHFGRVSTEAEIEELRQLLDRSLGMGENDLGVYALSILDARGSVTNAEIASTVRRYESARRELYPTPDFLSRKRAT